MIIDSICVDHINIVESNYFFIKIKLNKVSIMLTYSIFPIRISIVKCVPNVIYIQR